MSFPIPLLAWPPGRPVLTTLIYHRVLDAPDPLRPGEVDSGLFEAHARFLARHFSVLPLQEAARLLQAGRLPKRACCVTFDDGYADNLTVAAPILERYSLTATVFIATGYLDGGRMFNDAVIDAIAASDLDQVDLGELGLGVHRVGSPEKRRDAVTAILKQFRRRAPEIRERELPRLVELVGCKRLPPGPMLTRAQVAELAKRGIDIGVHTVTHPILTSVGDDRALMELSDNKRELEALTGQPIKLLAYPNGYPARDYDSRHVAMARQLGIEVAVTTARGVGNRDCDPLQLPRFALWGSSEGEWAMQLTKNAWTGKAEAAC